MTLRRRLLWSLSGAFLILWLSVAVLMYLRLDRQISETLDQRLAASANMVAGLIARQPEILNTSSFAPLFVTPTSEGVACQIQAATGELVLQTSGIPERLIKTPRPGYANRRIGDRVWRLYTLEQNGIFITTADRMSERIALTNGIILVMAVPFTLALIGGLAVLWWGIRSGLRPLQTLHDELRQRNPENLDAVRVEGAPAELSPVIETLNGLLLRVARTVAREQNFANNVAHEFRTPLTGLKTHLEVARRVEGQRQQQALANASQGVVRLQKVTEQLLLLARLERQGPLPASDGCSVDKLVEIILADAPETGRIRVDNRCSGYRIAVPDTLATVAVRNLVDNALKYSDAECTVIIERSQSQGPQAPKMMQILVRDTGIARQKRSSHTQPLAPNPDSHGLGLAIVEMIVTQYQGALISDYNQAGGMDWSILLPLAQNPRTS